MNASNLVYAAVGLAAALGASCAIAPLQPQSEARMAIAARSTDDAVTRAILQGPKVPLSIPAVRERLLGRGGQLRTHIVANRGHGNPEAGSFSFFETYTGPMAGGQVKDSELFIGYFSERQGNTLAVQQQFELGLIMELIAWDYTKRMYNFWELVGTGKTAEWKYRGDSADVMADVSRITMGDPSSSFGARLRCSGCHTQGGPIMKELVAPNNDWWTTKGKLALGSIRLSPGKDPGNLQHLAAQLFQEAEDASGFAQSVTKGLDRLVAAQGPGQPLKARMRSLFTTMEMNLASDGRPFGQTAEVAIPAEFFVDTRLTGPQPPVRVPAALYAEALAAVGSRFAPGEADLPETRNAFVVPVRSYVDNRMIDGLIADGLLDAELVADVLAVDLSVPVYSTARASLMRHLPTAATSTSDLRAKLLSSLEGARDPAARELRANLGESGRTAAFHRTRAIAYLEACRAIAHTRPAVIDWLKLASQRRKEVASAETARNPRGTILEPGFRVIFPVDRIGAAPGRWKLDPATGRL